MKSMSMISFSILVYYNVCSANSHFTQPIPYKCYQKTNRTINQFYKKKVKHLSIFSNLILTYIIIIRALESSSGLFYLKIKNMYMRVFGAKVRIQVYIF